jgi:hypothetical protein
MTFTELMALDAKSAATPPSPAATAPDRSPHPTPSTSPDSKRPRHQTHKTSGHHDTTVSRHQPVVASRHHETVMPRLEPSLVSRLRAAVKQLGQEGATHRFTAPEKERLAEIVYHYHRERLRTSENEIVRIAVNWLLHDHAARGEQGILHRVLRALHE